MEGILEGTISELRPENCQRFSNRGKRNIFGQRAQCMHAKPQEDESMAHGRTPDRLMGALEHSGRYGGEVRADRRLDSLLLSMPR